MIDFSNIAELKDYTKNVNGHLVTGKVAKIEKPVSHWDYFPFEMLKQAAFNPLPFYQTAKDT